MADQFDQRNAQARTGFGTAPAQTGETAVFDEGLRSHMLKVYNYMASGVLLTGIVALLFAQTQFAQNLMAEPSGISTMIMLLPLAFIVPLWFGMHRMKTSTIQLCFWGYAISIGLCFSMFFMVYSQASIARTFFATAASFSALSLWGYTTKKDLSGWFSFLFMGVIGLLIAMVLNIFLESSTLHWVISSVGVLVFAGLTAFYTQAIKSEYLMFRGRASEHRMAVIGGFMLYISFVNMFQFLLSFLGSSE